MEINEVIDDNAYSSKYNIDKMNDAGIKVVSRLSSSVTNGNRKKFLNKGKPIKKSRLISKKIYYLLIDLLLFFKFRSLYLKKNLFFSGFNLRSLVF